MSTPAPLRTVLVTGAARRLGREMALGLAAAGWQVAVHYRGSADDAQRTVADCLAVAAPGARVVALAADLADEAAARELLPRVVDALGPVDAVVNSASLFEHDTAQSFGYELLQRHLLANTAAPIVLAQALHRHLEARGGEADGVVVNLLDQKLWNPNPDFLSYTLSKAALEAANTLLAQALAPAGCSRLPAPPSTGCS
ncbi:MAG: SDR family NAD(P)-dependent oxidoreductase [Comamonadaceae bacterium]|nr:MAG: SDR family NAD(P)-dependent oxidoreductase [Comamonadaceae bacterium]